MSAEVIPSISLLQDQAASVCTRHPPGGDLTMEENPRNAHKSGISSCLSTCMGRLGVYKELQQCLSAPGLWWRPVRRYPPLATWISNL